MRKIHLLGLCASLRRESNNAVILRTMGDELMPPNVSLHIHTLQDLPLYNGDHDADEAPAPVVALRNAVNRVEGVVLASPEYSHGMSGVMKNALDWVVQPSSPIAPEKQTDPYVDGVACLHRWSPCSATTQRDLMGDPSGACTLPPIVIAEVEAKIRDGRLTDLATREFLAQGIKTMVQLLRMDTPKPMLTWA